MFKISNFNPNGLIPIIPVAIHKINYCACMDYGNYNYDLTILTYQLEPAQTCTDRSHTRISGVYSMV